MKNLLIASIICLFLSLICFTSAIGLLNQKHQREKHRRHQPYVQLDTEEQINPGDTLYVIATKNDTIFLYGK